MIRAVIIEDSRLARTELKEMLGEYDHLEVIGEADSGDKAIELIRLLKPDLIFLDIHLPGKNGFEILEELDSVPSVIFTTAFDAYALRSFDFNTLDYLLKPIAPERLKTALQKAEHLLVKKEGETSGKLGLMDRIFVKDRNQAWFVTLAQIRMFEAYGNYTRIYFDDHNPLILKTLQQVYDTVDDQFFIRANRQQLVNTQFVTSVEALSGNRLLLTLSTNEKVKVSRRQTVKVKAYYLL